MDQSSTQGQPSQPIPTHLIDQMNTLRQAGATAAIPLIVQLDEKAISALRNNQPTFGQDLARFSAKAAVAGVTALVVGVTYHYITAPPAMDMGT